MSGLDLVVGGQAEVQVAGELQGDVVHAAGGVQGGVVHVVVGLQGGCVHADGRVKGGVLHAAGGVQGSRVLYVVQGCWGLTWWGLIGL